MFPFLSCALLEMAGLRFGLLWHISQLGRKRKFLQGKDTEASKQKECNSRHPASSLSQARTNQPLKSCWQNPLKLNHFQEYKTTNILGHLCYLMKLF